MKMFGASWGYYLTLSQYNSEMARGWVTWYKWLEWPVLVCVVWLVALWAVVQWLLSNSYIYVVLDEDWYHSEDPVKSGVIFYCKVR